MIKYLSFVIINICFGMNTYKKPIILIPGLAGSVIYDRNNKILWPPNMYDIFLSNDIGKKLKIEYINDKFYTNYDTHTELLYNKNKKDNDITGIKIVNNNIDYFIDNKFLENIYNHFKLNHTIYSFPYDFRLVPEISYTNTLYNDFKESIEKIFNKNNETITIIGYSLGSLLLIDFLYNQDIEWRYKYINKIILINPPLKGSIIALNAIIIDKLFFHIKDINLNNFKYFGGIIWCLPDIYSGNIILNIDGIDIKNTDKYIDINIKTFYNKYIKNKRDIINELEDVSINIIYSTGHKTPNKLYIKKEKNIYKFDKYEYEDGDGVILINNNLNNNIKIHKMIGEHSYILKNEKLFRKIEEIIK
jgi:hypothetical protein